MRKSIFCISAWADLHLQPVVFQWGQLISHFLFSGFNWENLSTGFSLVEKECAKSEGRQDFLHSLILTGTLGNGRTFCVDVCCSWAGQKEPKAFCCVPAGQRHDEPYKFTSSQFKNMLIPAAAKYLTLHRYFGPPYGTSSSLCSSTAGWPSVLWRTWSWVSKRMNSTVSGNSLFSIGALTTVNGDVLLDQLTATQPPSFHLCIVSICVHKSSTALALLRLCASWRAPAGRWLGSLFSICCAALQRDTAKRSTVIPSSFRTNS